LALSQKHLLLPTGIVPDSISRHQAFRRLPVPAGKQHIKKSIQQKQAAQPSPFPVPASRKYK
jgi:hypothetical protein